MLFYATGVHIADAWVKTDVHLYVLAKLQTAIKISIQTRSSHVGWSRPEIPN